jgi:muramoyltetrapeptide carboxypeptidase
LTVIKPRRLHAGDRIAVVSPASPFLRKDLDDGVAELIRLGYQPVYEESIFERALFTSGSPETRAAAFRRAWDSTDTAALVAVRGGYGSAHLLPLFDGWMPQRSPKLFIGYSDNTSLLSWLTCHRGLTALHGPMLEGRFAAGEVAYDRTSFDRLARGEGVGLELAPDGVVVKRPGEAVGPLFGGTLTQLVASLGTPFAFAPPSFAVLFIEDVNERPYRVHRMLTQLVQSGVLARASGLVFGEMRGCDEPGGGPTVWDAIESVTSGFAGPVLYGFPSGHTTGPCFTLPLGVRVRMCATRRPALVIEESPVA